MSVTQITRRHWLKLVASAAAASGCDTVLVDVVDNGRTGDSIEPISPIGTFYVYEHDVPPDREVYDPAAWSCALMIGGETRVELTPALFEELVPIELEHTLQCIGGHPRNPLIDNAIWGGLPFVDVLDHLGITVPEATRNIRFVGADTYHTSIPISDLHEENLWLVWEMNGEPMPFEHGAPCRFLVRGRYGTKNVKWPVEVDFIDTDYWGFWERLGWSNEATYQQNGFVLFPFDGTQVPGPDVVIVGTAFAGPDPIARVEISFDEGQTWTDCDIDYSPGPHIWTLWRYVLEGASGVLSARIRVTTASGKVTNGTESTDQSNGFDGGMQVRFEVTA